MLAAAYIISKVSIAKSARDRHLLTHRGNRWRLTCTSFVMVCDFERIVANMLTLGAFKMSYLTHGVDTRLNVCREATNKMHVAATFKMETRSVIYDYQVIVNSLAYMRSRGVNYIQIVVVIIHTTVNLAVITRICAPGMLGMFIEARKACGIGPATHHRR